MNPLLLFILQVPFLQAVAEKAAWELFFGSKAKLSYLKVLFLVFHTAVTANYNLFERLILSVWHPAWKTQQPSLLVTVFLFPSDLLDSVSFCPRV